MECVVLLEKNWIDKVTNFLAVKSLAVNVIKEDYAAKIFPSSNKRWQMCSSVARNFIKSV